MAQPRDQTLRLPLAAARSRRGGPACAHGFGQRYDLPMPLRSICSAPQLRWCSRSCSSGCSCASVSRAHAIRLDLWRIGGWSSTRRSRWQSIARGRLSPSRYRGIRGNQDPYRNIAPTLVWIICWVGLAYVSAFLGDLWALINPGGRFSALRAGLDRMTGGGLSLRPPYPSARRLAGVLLLFAFSWIELVYPEPAVPPHRCSSSSIRS